MDKSAEEIRQQVADYLTNNQLILAGDFDKFMEYMSERSVLSLIEDDIPTAALIELVGISMMELAQMDRPSMFAAGLLLGAYLTVTDRMSKEKILSRNVMQ